MPIRINCRLAESNITPCPAYFQGSIIKYQLLAKMFKKFTIPGDNWLKEEIKEVNPPLWR